MGNLIPESLVWLDQIENLKSQTRAERGAELKKAYNLSKSQIINLLAVKACFDQAAIDKVRQAEKADPPFILSLNSAMALAGLKDRVDNLSGALHEALDVTLARRLATKKIKNLVIWVVNGKPASEFNPKAKPLKTPIEPSPKESSPTANAVGDRSGTSTSPGSQKVSISDLDHDKLIKLAQEAKAEKAQGKETTAREKLKNYIVKIAASLSPSKTSKSSSSDELLSETVLLDWLADINIFKQLKAKRKKGKSLTGGEWGLLAIHKLGEGLGHLAKMLLKLFKPFLKLLHWALKMVIEALKDLGLYKYAKAIFTLVVLIAVIWFTWEAFHYGVIRPVEMVWSKIHFPHFASEEAPTPIPTPSDISPSPAGISSPSHKIFVKDTGTQQSSVPKVIYQPAVSFIPSPSSTKTLYDPKILELEIAAIAQNSTIKDYVFQPDEGMPADLAVSRLQDLTDADKYTMMIGGEKQKILSVTPSNTNFIIAYKSTDLFGVFGSSSGTMNIFLEDVLYIHINETDHFSKPGAQPDIQYQCTVVAKGAKYPLTIQCASADDLENLVSTLEYFIRHSRLGHDAQPAGMPYTDQGIQFNNDRVVTLLWANSPAAIAVSPMETAQPSLVAPHSGVNQPEASQQVKAGLQLGDHLWSVEKITGDQQEKKDLEKGLASLPVTLFVASDADWTKAVIAKNSNTTPTFRPKLRKVVLGG